MATRGPCVDLTDQILLRKRIGQQRWKEALERTRRQSRIKGCPGCLHNNAGKCRHHDCYHWYFKYFVPIILATGIEPEGYWDGEEGP
jgi:hypothetical protein